MIAKSFFHAVLAVVLLAGCATEKRTARNNARERVLEYATEVPATPPYPHNSTANKRFVLRTFRRALGGDHKALARVFSDYAAFNRADYDQWRNVPWDILNAVGDKRFAAFISSQPSSIRSAAFYRLIDPAGGTGFELRTQFPMTAELYRVRHGKGGASAAN